MTMPREIDRHEARKLHAEGVLFLDVLPDVEFAASHVSDAINIPLKQLDRETIRGLDPDAPIVVYCHDSR